MLPRHGWHISFMTWYNEHPPEIPFDTPERRKAIAFAMKHGRLILWLVMNIKTVGLALLVLFVLTFCVGPAMLKRGFVVTQATPFITALQGGDFAQAADLAQDGSALEEALRNGAFTRFADLGDLNWENYFSSGNRGGVRFQQIRARAEVPAVPACTFDIYVRLTEGEPSHLSVEPACVRPNEDDNLGHAAPLDREGW